MKPLITVILLVYNLTTWAQPQDQALLRGMEKMAEALMHEQGADGRFEGLFSADPSLELLTLVAIKKFGTREPQIEKEFIEKALRWKSATGFGQRPGGPYNHDVTGVVLLALEELGYNLNTLGLGEIKKRFIANGGSQKFNIGTSFLITPMGLANSKLLSIAVRPFLFSIPDFMILSQKKIGILRTFLIPLAVWNFYQQKNPGPLLRKQAREGLDWILSHQMEDGAWYTVFHAISNLAALDAAMRAGEGDYTKQIASGIAAIKNWRRRDHRGELTQQITLTTGWDTPQALMALATLPKAMVRDHQNGIDDAVAFLEDHQIKVGGDWSANSPGLTPGGWSFIINNTDYPDTDVAAAVLEAKLAFPKNSSAESFRTGLDWILGLQNNDGGFPAWEKGVSKMSMGLVEKALPELPDFSDLSQVDVTARISRLLFELKHKGNKVLEATIDRACKFIKKSKDPRGHFWKGRWLVSYLYGTAEALDTLSTVGCASFFELTPVADWLALKQNSDGGFGEAHDSFIINSYAKGPSTVVQTAYVLNGLVGYETAYRKHFKTPSPFSGNIQRGVRYLLAQAKASNWMIREESYMGVIGAKLWYANYSMIPQYMSLRALGRIYALENPRFLES
jgi:squalene cyclase